MVNKANCLHMSKVFATKALTEKGIGYNQMCWKSTSRNDWSGEGCGTVACVAGWTVAALMPEVFAAYHTSEERGAISTTAATLLGLNTVQRSQLFGPWENPIGAADGATCAVAAVLKHLAETDIVDWSVGRKAVEKMKQEMKDDSDG